MVQFHFLCTLLLVGPALAQTPTGSITGTVFDPAGVPVAKASVKVSERATGRLLELLASESGQYVAANLLPGVYGVTVEASGYAPAELQGLVVEAGGIANGDIRIEAGNTTFRVTVDAYGPRVAPSKHVVDTVISREDIATLPLSSRNFLDLAALAPGVTVQAANQLDPTKTVAYRAVGVSGRLGAGTKTQIDGIDVTDPVGGSTLVNLSADAVQEFQISRSSIDISAPATSSGAISVITRSGGNELHGRAFWDFFNERLSARPQYQPTSDPFHTNRFGVSAGGPIQKNKLFWFVNTDQNFTKAQQFQASVEWPQLNVTQQNSNRLRYMLGRLDWNLTSSARLFSSVQYDSNLTNFGIAIPLRNVNWATRYVAGLDWGRGRITHSYRFGLVNYNNRIVSEEQSVPFPRTPGGTPFQLTVGAFAAGPYSGTQRTGIGSWQNNYTGTYFRSRHALRWGLNVNRLLTAARLDPMPLLVFGVFDTPSVNAIRARGGDVRDPLEYPLRNFAMGTNSFYPYFGAGKGLPYGAHRDTRTHAFVSDSWKPRPNLTLNFGLRWGYDTGYFGHDERIARDPVLDRWVAGASRKAGMPKGLLAPSFGFAWDPVGMGKTVIRGGFYRAYEGNVQNNHDQVAFLPSAFGVTFGHAFLALPDGRPFNFDGLHPNGSYRDWEGRRLRDIIGPIGDLHAALKRTYADMPFDNGAPNNFQVSRGSGGIITPVGQFKIPYSLQLNIGVQHELIPGTVLTVDYVRNRGVGLPLVSSDFERGLDSEYLNVAAARAQLNRVLGGRSVDDWIAANPRANISAFGLASDAIWPGLSPDFLGARFVVGGFSLYDSIQTSLRGRREHFGPLRDFTYLVTYTLGRNRATATDSNSEYNNGSVANARHWNRAEDFGYINLDRRHALQVMPVFRLPGGFQLGSTWTFRTAAPGNLVIPNLGGAIAGSNQIFGTDLDGDVVLDRIPGAGPFALGRSVRTFGDLNRLLETFNRDYGGQLTAHGRALVQAGLFNEAQLQRLGAVVPNIPLVPSGNPWPFTNLFTVDARLERSFVLERARSVAFSPFVLVNNVFNYAPPASYGGLLGRFGSMNFDYSQAPAGQDVAALNRLRGRVSGTRLVQVGLRVTF